MRPLYPHKIPSFFLKKYRFFSAFQLFLALALLLGCLISSTYGQRLFAVQKNRVNTLNVLGDCDAYYPDPTELSQIRSALVYAGARENGKWTIEGVCTDFEPDK
jgi:hypothetical protein